MVLRLLQVHTTREGAERVRPLFEQIESAWWQEVHSGEQGSQFAALVEVGREQKLLDELDLACATAGDSRIVVLPVAATLPRVEAEAAAETEREESSAPGRVSREELLDDVTAASQLSWNYVAMVVLSVGVVAIGLVRDSAAVVIGGMVLAPLLGPNIALGFAATLADGKLAAQALRTGAVGFAIALSLAIGVGLAFGIELDASGGIASAEIRTRTLPHVLDLLLAFAAGVAGAMSFTTALSTSLVGVMVAVALMPPLAVLGMCLGAGRWGDAEGALTLLLTNIVCVDLAAVLTFVAQAVRPRDWWQVKRRQRVVRVVIVALLVALVAVSVLLALHRRAHG